MGNYVLCYLRCYKELADKNAKPFAFLLSASFRVRPPCRDYYQYKKGLHNGDLFCIGDTNATNFELLLSPEYYLATMRLYEEIKRNNLISLQLSQTFDNDISLNEAKHYHSPPP